MLTFLKYGIIEFAPFVLPQNNWSFDSGKTNGVMPVHVMCNGELSTYESEGNSSQTE